MEIHLLHCYIEMTEKAGEQFCHLLDWRAMVATTILLLNLSHMHFLAASPACFIMDLSIIYSHVLNSFTKYSLNYIILCSMEERRSYMFWKDMRRNKWQKTNFSFTIKTKCIYSSICNDNCFLCKYWLLDGITFHSLKSAIDILHSYV